MSSLLAPDIRRMISDLGRRVGILERRVTGATSDTGTPANNDIIFSYAGALTVAESPPAKLRYGGFLVTLAVAFGTAGSTSTTLEVKRNGAVIGTVVVPSSTTDYSGEIAARVVGEDRITIEITTAGTGAADMTAAARFT